MAYDPWQHLHDLACADLTLEVSLHALPDGYLGYYHRPSNTIHLDNRLTPVEARCTLAHELVHYERHDDPRVWRRAGLTEDLVEEIVSNLAAIRLITTRALRAAVAKTDDEREQARRLHVDLGTLQARKATKGPVR